MSAVEIDLSDTLSPARSSVSSPLVQHRNSTAVDKAPALLWELSPVRVLTHGKLSTALAQIRRRYESQVRKVLVDVDMALAWIGA